MKQITFEELGMIPVQVDRSKYATPCGGCICSHCANNVDCMDTVKIEMDFPCFNCDECLNFNGDRGTDNWKPKCRDYIITDHYAKIIRKNFKVIKGGKEI